MALIPPKLLKRVEQLEELTRTADAVTTIETVLNTAAVDEALNLLGIEPAPTHKRIAAIMLLDLLKRLDDDQANGKSQLKPVGKRGRKPKQE